MLERKLQIYLDSADYSALSNPIVLQRDSQKAEVRDHLVSLVQNEKIEIRYSALNLGEATHDSAEYKRSAVQRAQLLMDLTKGRTFNIPFNIFFEDARSLISPLEDSNIYFEGNAWLGRVDFTEWAGEAKTCFVEQCKKLIDESGLPRAQRKQLHKAFFKNGQLSKTFLDQLHNEAAMVPPLIDGDALFLEKFAPEGAFLQFLHGAMSAHEFGKQFLNRAMDAEFVISEISSWDPESRERMRNWIRGHGANLLQMLERCKETVINAETKLLDMGIAEDQLQQHLRSQYPRLLENSLKEARKRILASYYPKHEDMLIQRGITSAMWNDVVVCSDLGSIRSLDLYLYLLKQYVHERIKDRLWRFTESDGPDLLHACYAPHCDIIRVDKRTYDLFSKLPSDFRRSIRATFVRKTEELPKAIDAALQLL